VSRPNEAYWAQVHAEQEAKKADAARRFGPAAQDLADYIAECDPDSASDFEGVVEQWISEHGGQIRRRP
jgi:hypothetical protein